MTIRASKGAPLREEHAGDFPWEIDKRKWYKTTYSHFSSTHSLLEYMLPHKVELPV